MEEIDRIEQEEGITGLPRPVGLYAQFQFIQDKTSELDKAAMHAYIKKNKKFIEPTGAKQTRMLREFNEDTDFVSDETALPEEEPDQEPVAVDPTPNYLVDTDSEAYSSSDSEEVSDTDSDPEEQVFVAQQLPKRPSTSVGTLKLTLPDFEYNLVK